MFFDANYEDIQDGDIITWSIRSSYYKVEVKDGMVFYIEHTRTPAYQFERTNKLSSDYTIKTLKTPLGDRRKPLPKVYNIKIYRDRQTTIEDWL